MKYEITDEDVANFKPVMDPFEKSTGIKVNMVSIPYEEFQRKLLLAFIGKTAPDIAIVDFSWIPSFLR